MRSIAHGEVVHRDCLGLAPRREQRRLVDQVGEVGAGEAGGERRDLIEVDVGAELDLADMHHEDLHAPGLVGPVDQHLAIEAAGAQQRRIENLRAVGRGEQHDAGRGSKPSSSARSWFSVCSFSSWPPI